MVQRHLDLDKVAVVVAIYAEDATVIMHSKDTDAFGIEGRTDTTLPYTAPRTRRVGGHLDNFDALKRIVTRPTGRGLASKEAA